jgi:hypothetical protein
VTRQRCDWSLESVIEGGVDIATEPKRAGELHADELDGTSEARSRYRSAVAERSCAQSAANPPRARLKQPQAKSDESTATSVTALQATIRLQSDDGMRNLREIQCMKH